MGYIRRMRELIGNETLLTTGCGVIIEKDGQILLQHRTDEDNWCIPGGNHGNRRNIYRNG